jgi:hypothetical protein
MSLDNMTAEGVITDSDVGGATMVCAATSQSCLSRPSVEP